MKPFYVWILLVPALVGPGCLGLKPARDITRHLVLSTPEVEAPGAPAAAAKPALAILPVVIPEYLDNPWMVVRENDNEIRHSAVCRWGEPFAQGARRVLATQLRRLLPETRVEAGSWRPGAIDWELAVYFDRCETLADGRVVMEARWRLTTPLAARPTESGVFRADRTGPAPEADPVGAVATLSLALTDLARDLAGAISAAGR